MRDNKRFSHFNQIHIALLYVHCTNMCVVKLIDLSQITKNSQATAIFADQQKFTLNSKGQTKKALYICMNMNYLLNFKNNIYYLRLSWLLIVFSYWVYNKKPSPRKIFIKNSFFNLIKQNVIYSLLTYSTSFEVILMKK